MLVVKKTKAILHRVAVDNDLPNSLIEICRITLNSSIIKEGVAKGKLYNLAFTAAYMIPMRGTLDTIEKDKSEERKKTETEKSKTTLSEATVNMVETLEHIKLERIKRKKKKSLMVYLADSNAYVHVYNVAYLDAY